MPIRVLIVDDSFLWSSALTEALEEAPDIRVVGCEGDGAGGLAAVERRRPDVVLMDVRMPVLGGFEAIAEIMSRHPTPILVMTGDPRGVSGEFTLEALRRGALDLMTKDAVYPLPRDFVDTLHEKVRLLAGVRVVRHVGVRAPATPTPATPAPTTTAHQGTAARIVAMVASTGGPAALATILQELPTNFAAGMAIVQHMATGFTPTFAEWLDSVGPIRVRLARDGDVLCPGLALVAPDDVHMLVRVGGRIALDRSPPHGGHRPSGDLLLESVARSFGRSALGVVLTGMGADGADGLAALREAGGDTLAQDAASSVVFGMPQAAMERGAAGAMVPLKEIASRLVRSTGTARRTA